MGSGIQNGKRSSPFHTPDPGKTGTGTDGVDGSANRPLSTGMLAKMETLQSKCRLVPITFVPETLTIGRPAVGSRSVPGNSSSIRRAYSFRGANLRITGMSIGVPSVRQSVNVSVSVALPVVSGNKLPLAGI